MSKIIRDDYVVVDRVYSGYLEDFIDQYGMDSECGQNSYFVIELIDIDELLDFYPTHKEALETFREELADSGKSKALFKFWW